WTFNSSIIRGSDRIAEVTLFRRAVASTQAILLSAENFIRCCSCHLVHFCTFPFGYSVILLHARYFCRNFF
ncbi:hypothetical protein PMAYCL1PPCAC_18886, partial [Pristionchus mayeri]